VTADLSAGEDAEVDPRALGGPVELVAREARSEGGSGRAGSPRRLVATRRSRPSLACEQATESAMEAGTVQPVSQRQLVDAVRSIRPSFGEWMETAKTMPLYGKDSATYDELAAYLKRRRR
jgi:hypothetical protein